MLAHMKQRKSVLIEDGEWRMEGEETPKRVCLLKAAYLFGFTWSTDGQLL